MTINGAITTREQKEALLIAASEVSNRLAGLMDRAEDFGDGVLAELMGDALEAVENAIISRLVVTVAASV